MRLLVVVSQGCSMNSMSDRVRMLNGNLGTLRLPNRTSNASGMATACVEAAPPQSAAAPAYHAAHAARASRPLGESDDTPRVDGVVRSEALLSGRNRLTIQHNDETYQLRVTRLGKLILTK
jgi:hemin uptake protein HemP